MNKSGHWEGSPDFVQKDQGKLDWNQLAQCLRLCSSAKHFLDVSMWPIDRYRTHKCSQSMGIYGHRNQKINQMRLSEKVIQLMVAILRGIQTHPNLGYLGYLDPYSPLNHINTSLEHFSSCHLCMRPRPSVLVWFSLAGLLMFLRFPTIFMDFPKFAFLKLWEMHRKREAGTSCQRSRCRPPVKLSEKWPARRATKRPGGRCQMDVEMPILGIKV